MIYKVSYVVKGGEFPGSIRNQQTRPEIGDTVQIGPNRFTVIEVHEMMPPREGFQFVQAIVADSQQENTEEQESYW